jgi:pentose-5-phosphate-3-epimerase
LSRTVQRIKAMGKRIGVVINPASPAAVLEEVLRDIDQVLVMTVNPGFGHQHFLHTTLPKIRRVRLMIDRINPKCDLAVEGDIDPTSAPLAVDAGANVLVAGSSIFGSCEGVAAAMKKLRAAANHELTERVEDCTNAIDPSSEFRISRPVESRNREIERLNKCLNELREEGVCYVE